MSVATVAVGLALLFDLAIGEPPERIHPVVALGSVIAWTDREWARPATAGLVVALGLPLGAAVLAAGAVAVALRYGRVPGTVAAGAVLFTTVSLRSLVTTGARIVRAAGRDPTAAAEDARALVGRDTATLGPGALRSAAVESVAENLADGLVGPLAAFVLGSLVSLPFAAAAAVWVKVVNTLDSMLGYRTHPMGRASARLDDAVAWLPARIAAVLLAVASGRIGALVDARTWAAAPSSPNSGWPMATAASALDVTLVKPGAYALNPGAGLPSETRALAGVRAVRRVGLLAFALAGVVTWW